MRSGRCRALSLGPGSIDAEQTTMPLHCACPHTAQRWGRAKDGAKDCSPCCSRRPHPPSLPPAAAMPVSPSCQRRSWTWCASTIHTSWSWTCPGAGHCLLIKSPAWFRMDHSRHPVHAPPPAPAPPPTAHAVRRPPPRSNALTDLPASLSQLPYLRTLRLNYNGLRKLPPVLAQLPQLMVRAAGAAPQQRAGQARM